MDSAQNQLAERLKTANNVLVSVSRNPSVDQLAACLGLTLFLNKLDKHAAAVFSGQVPSTIEFLQPEETLEKTTDSLRDFIIALDKSKADKLRYKVEDDVVRIFITPYRTSITQDDLDFSQGDFNVDVVIALGVQKQEDLDEAITAHGRILHDATVSSINVAPAQEGGLGTINWYEPGASSLSELVTVLLQLIDPNLLDAQIATALLTGIVAETARFSNDKTSSQTMTVSASLMAAGANQQLVASKLETQGLPTQNSQNNSDSQADNNKPEADKKADDGTLRIEHEQTEESNASDKASEEGDGDANQEQFSREKEMERAADDDPATHSKAALVEPPEATDQGSVDSQSAVELPEPIAIDTSSPSAPSRPLLTDPPVLGGTLTANSQVESLDPSTDPLGVSQEEPPQLLDRNSGPASLSNVPLPDIKLSDSAQPEPAAPISPPESNPVSLTPPPPGWVPPAPPAAPVDDTVNPTSDTAASDLPTPTAGNDNSVTDTTQIDTSAPAPVSPPAEPNATLSDLEAAVHSSHLAATPTSSVDTARDEVSKALNSDETVAPAPTPIEALNAQPLGNDLHPQTEGVTITPSEPTAAAAPLVTPSLEEQIPGLTVPSTTAVPPPTVSNPSVPLPPSNDPAQPNTSPAAPQVIDANAPPPVPPPIPFQFGAASGSSPAQQ